jgi:FkbM family methyltransferase
MALAGMNFGNLDPSSSGERHLLEHIFQTEKDVIIFDVGANKGQYLNQLESVFDESAIVHAFEPSKVAYEKLFEAHGRKHHISLVNVGLGRTRQQSVPLHSVKFGDTDSSIVRKEIPNDKYSPQAYQESIELYNLDEYVESNNIPQITLLKIDVEGHELEVLKGGSSVLDEGRIKYIQFEFGENAMGRGLFFLDLYKYLVPKYRIFRLVKDGWIELNEYDLRMEVFTGCNFLAIHRDIGTR